MLNVLAHLAMMSRKSMHHIFLWTCLFLNVQGIFWGQSLAELIDRNIVIKCMGLEVKHIKPTPKSTYLPVAWSTEQWSLKVSLAYTNQVLNQFHFNIFYTVLNGQEKLSDSLISTELPLEIIHEIRSYHMSQLLQLESLFLSSTSRH